MLLSGVGLLSREGSHASGRGEGDAAPLAKFIRKAGCLLTVSILSYVFNPKKAAAHNIAAKIVGEDMDEKAVGKKLVQLKVRDEQLYNYIIEELNLHERRVRSYS